LGDALSYVLTTAENELGVVVAKSESGNSRLLFFSEVLIIVTFCTLFVFVF